MSASTELPTVFGPYRVEKKLGEGGMGAVYLALDSKLGRKVALKVPKLTTDADIQRFEREARAAAAIDHPNVCPIHSIDCHAGVHFLTMPFIDGTPLDRVINPADPPSPMLAIVWVRKLASALQALHAAGLIHRDLKPGNVILKHGKEPVLMDFGLARAVGDAGLKLTNTGAALGTPMYMSPEQTDGAKDIGPATDIYSLGVILFELLTGRRPFETEASAELHPFAALVKLFERIRDEPPPAPSSLRPGLDLALDAICLKALAKKPAERYASMTEFATALERVTARGRTTPGVGATLAATPGQPANVPQPPIPVVCPACNQRLRLSPASRGKRVRCPACQRAFVASGDLPTQPAPAPPPRLPTPLLSDVPTPPPTNDRTGRYEPSAISFRTFAVLAALVLFTGLFIGWVLFGQREGRPRKASRTEEVARLDADDHPAPPRIGFGPGNERKPAAAAPITNQIGMRLVLVPAGSFTMGSPPTEAHHRDDETPHEVTITRPFYLGAYEVKQEEYERVMGNNPSWFSATGGGKDKVVGLNTFHLPVENVSHQDAEAFCRKLSALPEEQAAGRVYRLPTEAEWEYACREAGAAKTPFHFGPTLSSKWANFDGNYPYGSEPRGPYLERTTTVDDPAYQPNALGLYHMHGNVCEWCADWYDEGYYTSGKREDPRGPEPRTFRVLRGGSWFSGGYYCRAAYRDANVPGYRDRFAGFRVVLTAPTP